MQRLPFALFSVGLTMVQDVPDARARADSFLAPLKKAAQPVSVGLFGGLVDADRAPFPIKLAVKAMPQGDYRDWDAIRAWAESLRGKLAS